MVGNGRQPLAIRSTKKFATVANFCLPWGVARENVTQGISFSPGLLARAKARAAEKGLSFSSYVQQLVLADLESSDLAKLPAATVSQIMALYQELAEYKEKFGPMGDVKVAEEKSPYGIKSSKKQAG